MWHKGYAVLTAVVAVGAVLLLMLLWLIVALIFRRRFQFSIRGLLILTVAVAVSCSWLAVEMKAARKQREIVATIEKCGGDIGYDYQFDASLSFLPKAHTPGLRALRNVLGDDFFAHVANVYIGIHATDAELTHLVEDCPRLWALSLAPNDQITDAGIAHLKGLPQLQLLFIDSRQITDAGLAHLAELTQIQYLSLKNNPTDAAMKKLQQALPKCQIQR